VAFARASEDCVTVHMGFGRERAGRVGGNIHERPPVEKRGFNVYPIRSSGAMWSAGVDVKATGETMLIACTQTRSGMINYEARELLKIVPIHGSEHGEGHGEKAEHGHRTVSLNLYPPRGDGYPDDVRKGNKWGMVIDQNACIGCSACVVACQAENNIAVVGKDQVRPRPRASLAANRHLLRRHAGKNPRSWKARISSRLRASIARTRPANWSAPPMRPSHDAEGTNNMVYNRCIGTRYCSNNCPTRFAASTSCATATTGWARSAEDGDEPERHVRSIGVMEKCSYCVQRINAARIERKKDSSTDRAKTMRSRTAKWSRLPAVVPDAGDLFRQLNDKDFSNNGKGSIVRMMLGRRGNYALLDEELQTLPRTSYLPRYTNRAEKKEG
jgi:molybdopterin-containing oxidoreductase family iron-sulfur binding subunit